MKELTPDKFREGLKVTCNIYGNKIFDAKIHQEKDGWYICQNKIDGYSCKNKLEYKYSYFIGFSKNLELFNVTCLKSLIDLKNRIKILKKELNK
jgi:hypothetical protein